MDLLTRSTGANLLSNDRLLGTGGRLSEKIGYGFRTRRLVAARVTEVAPPPTDLDPDGIFEFNPGDDFLFNEVGEGARFSADLQNAKGDIVGTSVTSFEITEEVPNDGTENAGLAYFETALDFGSGTVVLGGEIDIQTLEDLEPQQVNVLGGTGVYEGIRGVAFIEQPGQEINIVDYAFAGIVPPAG